MNITTTLLVIAAAVLIVMVLVCTENIPPKAITRTRISITKQRVCGYFAVRHRLPAKLSDLQPLKKNRDGSFMDGWGRPIQYTVKDMAVILLSLGKDGQLGGTGEDADIQVTFAVGGEKGSGVLCREP
ncbi:MAG: hypothetical protein GXP38_12905 [Chloroflexi bacterium]|nr:hypothetical protein [Chloroflexota bacterium]